jgi:hypothetical protein
MTDQLCSADELEELRAHGIVVFADRVIFNAQPPIDDATLQWVEERLAGPIPAGLRSLWSITAGGSLDYQLFLDFGSHAFSASWTELFYRGSNSYRDLTGWIEYEQELAEQAAEDGGTPFDGRLSVLPVGGFEYLDRLYVVVEGTGVGGVLFWAQGLPPAWTNRLHADSVAALSADVPGAFARLALYRSTGWSRDRTDFWAGSELRNYLDERIAEHGMRPALAEVAVRLHERAVQDWRVAAANGSLTGNRALIRAGFEDICEINDLDALELLRPYLDLDRAIVGDATPADAASIIGSDAVAKALRKRRWFTRR